MIKKIIGPRVQAVALAFALLIPMSVYAANNPTTVPANVITTSNATLNAINGDGDAIGHSFWASLASFSTASPVLPPGVFSTPDFGAISSTTAFSALLSSTGVTVNPNTQYYFAAWSNVGGTWYPGSVLTLTTQGLAQTITFGPLANATYGDAAVALTATASSALPVTFSTPSAASICTVAGSTVTITGPGVCQVDANQTGMVGSYSAAPTVSQSFTIAPKALTATLTNGPLSKVYDGNQTVTPAPTFSFVGLVGVDAVTVSSANYADENVANAKAVSIVWGGDAAKYTITTVPAAITGDITPKTLIADTSGGFGVMYFGGTTLTGVTPAVALTGVVLGDVVTNTGTITFSDKNVGNPKSYTVSGLVLGGADAGNYAIASTAVGANGNIIIRPITVTAAASTKVYDGNTSSPILPTVTSGTIQPGDTASFTQTYDNANVAGSPTKTMTPAGAVSDGNAGANYAVTFVTANVGTITAAPITLSGVGIATKVYDGTTTATLNLTAPVLVGVLPADAANVAANFAGATAVFADKHAGVGKPASVSGITLLGPAAGNYTLNQPIALTGDISKRPITVTAQTNTKVYDGNTTSGTTPTITAGAIQIGDLAVLTQSYATKTVGTGKTLIPAATINDGNSGNNYLVTLTNDVTGSITARSLTVSASGINKVYDGTTAATVAFLDDRVLGDVLTVSGTAAFTDKNVGAGKTVNVTGISISGTDAGNYTLANTTTTTTADITARPLMVTATADNKVYDTTTNATVHFTDDRLLGDVFGVTGLGAFSDKNVANGKTVFLGPVSLSGPDAGNYSVLAVTNPTANITPASLTASFGANNKIYDATTAATVFASSLSGVLLGDVVTIGSITAAFADKHAGTGKTVTATVVLGGGDAGNYVVSSVVPTTADITQRPITVTAQTNTKVYDATTAASTLPLITTGAIQGTDSAVLSETYDTKHVGTGKTLTPTIVITDGNGGANYLVTLVNDTTGIITKKALTVTATGINKVYDATTTASVSLSGDHIAGDDVTLAATSYFADKNVGAAKPVTAFLTFSGADIYNYSTTSPVMASADITVKPVTTTFTIANKVFDGNTNATITGSTTVTLIAPDDVALTGATAAFDDSAVGNGKLVTISGFSLIGTDAPNYALAAVTATTTANITAVPVSGGGGGGGGGSNGPTAGLAPIGVAPGTSGGQVLGIATSSPVVPGFVGNPTTGCSALITQNLRRGARNDVSEVRKLQQFLNANLGTTLPISGVYGPLTEAAVRTFQIKYAAQILAPIGLTSPTGNVLGATRAVINQLNCGNPINVSARIVGKPTPPTAPRSRTPAPTPRPVQPSQTNQPTQPTTSDETTTTTQSQTTAPTQTFFSRASQFLGGLLGN